SAGFGLCLIALGMASCGSPRPSDLPDSGGTGGTDGAPPARGLELLAGGIGGPGYADGPGATARFGSPASVAGDSVGNVYVADALNNTLRKIAVDRVVTTLAGNASMAGSADGTGAAARFHFPGGVAVDSAGNVYVADSANYAVRKVTADGVVTTL